MGNHTLVRTDHLDQSMATQIEGNINAVSTTQLQKLAPTGRSITSIRNELERGESTLISESPHTSLFVETEEGLELNTDHAITLAHEAVQTLASRLIPAPVANWFSQTFSEETTDSLPPAVEPEMLPPENTPHAPAPQSAYRYNLEVACPPDMHQKYLPGIVSLAKISGKEDAVTLSRNTEKLEHYWLKAMTITNDSRKLYYKPQGSTCSHLFSFEVALVDADTERADEALVPITPAVQVGKRLGFPTKGYFYHFYNGKLIQEFKIKDGTCSFSITSSYTTTLTDDIKINKLQSHILLYWRLDGEKVTNQHVLYREKKLTPEELSSAHNPDWLNTNGVEININNIFDSLSENIISKTHTQQPVKHILKPGDSFNKLRRNYNTTVKNIQKLNPTVQNLFVGKKITISDGSNELIKEKSFSSALPKKYQRQENIYYEYPTEDIAPNIKAIKLDDIDHNIVAVNVSQEWEELINYEKFLQAYNKIFRDMPPPLNAQSQENIKKIIQFVNKFYKDHEELEPNIHYLAYFFATGRHEAYNDMLATYFNEIEEYSGSLGDTYFIKKYDIAGNPQKAHELGNINRGDGVTFKGRGFCQITGRSLYRRLSLQLGLGNLLVEQPELAKKHKYGVPLALYGMHKALFTKYSFSDFLNSTEINYVKSRKMINGMDSAEIIAKYAIKFEQVLKVSSRTTRFFSC